MIKFAILFTLLSGFLSLSMESHAQKKIKEDNTDFFHALDTIISSAKYNYDPIRGKFERGIDGLFDGPYMTYLSKINIPDAAMNYIISNRSFSDNEQTINVFVCNYAMSTDSTIMLAVYNQMVAKADKYMKSRHIRGKRYKARKGDGDIRILRKEYLISKRKTQMEEDLVLTVSFEHKRYFTNKLISGFVVYLKLSKI